MAGFHFITETFEFVTLLITESIGTNVAAINEQLGLVMVAAFGLYAVYMGYTWFMADRADSVKQGLQTFVLLGVISFIALKGTYYNDTIVPIILDLGDGIANLISNSGGAPEMLDQFATMIFSTVIDIWDKAEFSVTGESNMFESLLTICLLLIGSAPFIVTSFGILLTAKFMVALLLSVGTIFICFAFFPQTRTWFMQWIGMCWNYVLIATLFPIALSIEMTAIKQFVYVGGVLTADMSTAFKLLVVLGAFLAISTQIPTLASSLSGGVGINGMSGSFSSMMGSLRSVTNPMLSGGKSLGKGAGKAGMAAYQWRQKRKGNNIKAG
ncbi:conjugal transfer protein TraA [Vibrio ichthyoenteri ATCC 700023]|uniref:Conjugal transfer protein TraA n=1 Tax=Vibrio ichthyoenteri ATCC 700023 TaxID=870968 RepID=F9S7I2_9VIBR|nr:type IV secretion system protein [Vibrio ichthyoenteri]EGU31278.1 conjugal transfer protein TraA [Vibrio ichthyoenteri ATCC 700023]